MAIALVYCMLHQRVKGHSCISYPELYRYSVIIYHDYGVTISDIDECLEGKDKCASDQICLNTLGSYKCFQDNKTAANGMET